MPTFSPLAALLLSLLAAPVEANGLLGGLTKQLSQSPDELAQAFKEKAEQVKEKAEQVAKTTPQDITNTIKDALNASAVKEDPTEELKSAAHKQAAGAMQTVTAGALNEQTSEVPATPQDQLSKALRGASEVLQKGASVVAKANASDAGDLLKAFQKGAHAVAKANASEDLLKGAGQVELLDQAKVLEQQIKSGKLSREEIASRLRQASRSASLRFNTSSMTFADVLRTKIPQAAMLLDQMGTAVADGVSGGIEKVTGTKVSSEHVKGLGFLGFLFGTLGFCGVVSGLGFWLVVVKSRREARGPGLLTDAVSSEGGRATGSRAGIQMPDTESTSFVGF